MSTATRKTWFEYEYAQGGENPVQNLYDMLLKKLYVLCASGFFQDQVRAQSQSRPNCPTLEFTTFLNVLFNSDDGSEQLIQSAPHRRNKK